MSPVWFHSSLRGYPQKTAADTVVSQCPSSGASAATEWFWVLTISPDIFQC